MSTRVLGLVCARRQLRDSLSPARLPYAPVWFINGEGGGGGWRAHATFSTTSPSSKDAVSVRRLGSSEATRPGYLPISYQDYHMFMALETCPDFGQSYPDYHTCLWLSR